MDIKEAAQRAVKKCGANPINASAAAFIARMLLIQAGARGVDAMIPAIRDEVDSLCGTKRADEPSFEEYNDETDVRLQTQAEEAEAGDE